MCLWLIVRGWSGAIQIEIKNLIVMSYVERFLIGWIVLSDKMVSMGYCRKDIEEALSQNKYNDLTATYLLLGRKTSEVRWLLSHRTGVVDWCLGSNVFVWLSVLIWSNFVNIDSTWCDKGRGCNTAEIWEFKLLSA